MTTTTRPPGFDIGDQPTLVFTFKDPDGVLTTPTAVSFRQRSPSGALTTEALSDATVRSVGVVAWTIPAPFNAPGTWKYRASATGTVVVAEEMELKVRKSNFPTV